jgi:hypothetical protein
MMVCNGDLTPFLFFLGKGVSRMKKMLTGLMLSLISTGVIAATAPQSVNDCVVNMDKRVGPMLADFSGCHLNNADVAIVAAYLKNNPSFYLFFDGNNITS